MEGYAFIFSTRKQVKICPKVLTGLSPMLQAMLVAAPNIEF